MGRWLAGAVMIGMLATAASCSDSDDKTGVSETPATVLETSAPATTSSAPIVAADGTDPLCAQMAANTALTGLSATIHDSAISGVAPDVSVAADALTAVAATFPSATPAADALRAWAAATTDPAAVDVLAAAFSALDTEVQATCHFPLG